MTNTQVTQLGKPVPDCNSFCFREPSEFALGPTSKSEEVRENVMVEPEMEELPIAKVAEDTMIRPKVEVDVSYAKVIEVVQCKSAAQVFMEEKAQKIKTKQKMEAKLALLKKEVKMGQQLLQQTKTLLKGKEALVQRKVRVTYNRCHKFWRGQVILAHKSDVEKQVDAAKKRLGLGKSGIKFDISAMVQKIDKLSPGARY